jgi:hypothetical protein
MSSVGPVCTLNIRNLTFVCHAKPAIYMHAICVECQNVLTIEQFEEVGRGKGSVCVVSARCSIATVFLSENVECFMSVLPRQGRAMFSC